MKDVFIGNIYYTPNHLNNHGPRVLKGVVIEINKHHQTVLIQGLMGPCTSNFGTHISKLYKTEEEAYNAQYRED